jgi:hypothetical protein
MSASSQSFFQRSRSDVSLTMSALSPKPMNSTMTGLQMSPKEKTKERLTLSEMGKSNTLSVFEKGSRPLNTFNMSMTQSSHRMSIIDVRVVKDEGGLPETFDVERIKTHWKDSKICQLCEIKFGIKTKKHH